MPPAWTTAAAATFALAAGLAVLLSCRAAICQTTLVAAWWWSLAALVAWGGVELAAALWPSAAGQASFAALRLAAVSLSFCPIVALLGAKRPQHVAWNFVVLSLWAILALPAAETLLLHPGQRLSVGDAHGWFLWILICLSAMNFVPTRYVGLSGIFAAAQIIALAPHLPLVRRAPFPESELGGLVGAAVGLVFAWLISRCPTTTANSYDRLWLDFRDSFGLFWGLRVQERINAAARQYGWDLELSWGGFRRRGSHQPLTAIDPAIEPALRTTFKGLLRRFVSNRWIDQRL